MRPRTQHGPARAEKPGRRELRARLRSGSHWTAHFAALLAVVTSCVVSNPPEYSSAEQTPPLLELLEADPSVSKVLQVRNGDLLKVNVPIRSQDEPGDELFARLYLDYGLDTEEVQRPLLILPVGSFDDLEREVEMSWVIPEQLGAGCRQLMLVVTHRSNLDSNARPLQNDDTAVAVWWLNINDTNSDNPMSGCPAATVAQ